MAVTVNKYSIGMSAAADATDLTVGIQGIYWGGISTNGHQLLVKDASGTIMIGTLIGAANVPVEIHFPNPIVCVGLEADVLGSGIVQFLLC